MILSYSFPQFEQMILEGEKIHTFRKDPTWRWKAGLRIEHYMGSPRNPKSNPRCILKSTCFSVQRVSIMNQQGEIKLAFYDTSVQYYIASTSPRIVSEKLLHEIVKNDGLSIEEFKAFFTPNNEDIWMGGLIHWTEKLY